MKRALPDRPLRHDWLLTGLILLLVWLPIPLGSNRLLFWSLAEIAIAALLAAWAIGLLRGSRHVTSAWRDGWPLYLPLAVWCGYVALQLVPLPPAWLDALSPQSAWVHGLTIHAPGARPAAPVSVDPFSTGLALQKSLAYVALVVLVLLLADSHTRLRRVALAVTFAGVVQAGFALLDLNLADSVASANVNGTFANRNHFANFVALAFGCGLGLLLTSLGGTPADRLRTRVRLTLEWLLSGKMRLRLLLLLMAVAIVLSRSRMGNVAFFGGMTVAGLAMLTLSRQHTRATVLLLASIVALDVVVIGSLIGAERVVERLEATSLAAETRDEVARDSLVYRRDFALTGSGLGTFYVTYPRYKQGDVSLFYRQAHNDYLQFAVEAGWLGAWLPAAATLATLAMALRTLRRRRDPLVLALAFAAVMAVSVSAIHALVEFNLQIFANAATLLVILAMAWSARALARDRPQHAAAIGVTTRRLVGAGTLAACAAYVSWVAITAFAGLIGDANRDLLARWQAAGSAPAADVGAALQRQIDAIELTPRNADAKLLLSRIAWWQDRDGGAAQPDTAPRVLEQMLYALLTATRDNPGQANTWLAIAKVRFLQRDFDAVFQTALSRTAQLAPWEPHVQRAAARIGLAAWDALPSAQRRQVAQTVRRGLAMQADAMRAIVADSGRGAALCADLGGDAPDALCNGAPGRPAAPPPARGDP